MSEKPIFDFDGQRFEAGAADVARLRDDGDGNFSWVVPTRDGGQYETTDEGLRILREAERRQSL